MRAIILHYRHALWAAAFLLLALLLPAGAQTVTLTSTVTSSWGTGYQASVVLQNMSATPVVGWTLEFDLSDPITSMWDGSYTAIGSGRHRATNLTWNGTIPAFGAVSFGFVAQGNGTATVGNACLNGAPAPANGVPSAATCIPIPPPVAPPPTAPVPDNPSGKKIVGYFAAWGVYGRNFHVADINGDLITHINYAFANISPAGTAVLGDPYADTQRVYPGDDMSPGALHGSFNQLLLLKARKPHIKTLISIGGWTWSSGFSVLAATASGRTTFAQSAIDFMVQYGFDGIDVDWEYPVSGGLPGNVTSPNDRSNFTLLLQELRAQLTARELIDGRSYLLTIAGPAGPSIIANLEIPLIHPLLDWINLMSYDFHGSWSTHTNFNAPLYPAPGDPNPPATSQTFNVDAAVTAWINQGVPPSKLHMGVPFYGRGFANVGPTNGGLFQPFNGIPMGSFEPGVFDYKDLLQNYIPSSTRTWNAASQVPWLYNPATQVMISYDDPDSITAKANAILAHNLGGAMLWEFSGDTPSNALLRSLSDRLLTPAPWIQVSSSGQGIGDLTAYIYGAPTGATHVFVG
ncbi:MAG TPA: glycosyl hydrolase family 18 protein, partial [Planctomycetota bacterium]|nr:glycosyl hydrolase family 18 protein [Planctomycetota bacterium]